MSSTNGRKNVVIEDCIEEGGPGLSHVKSSGGMTISPELFEKVDGILDLSSR